MTMCHGFALRWKAVNEGQGTYVVALLDDHEVEHGQVGTDDGTADGLALALTLHITNYPRKNVGE